MSGEPLDIRVIGFVSQTARHFALASRTSGPLARHIIYTTALVPAAPQASCTSLSLSARARHGNTGPARASACGHMNHDYARLPVCTRSASRCPPTDPVPSIETARNARSSLRIALMIALIALIALMGSRMPIAAQKKSMHSSHRRRPGKWQREKS